MPHAWNRSPHKVRQAVKLLVEVAHGGGGRARGLVLGNGQAEVEGLAVGDVLVEYGLEGGPVGLDVFEDLAGEVGAALDLVEEDRGAELFEGTGDVDHGRAGALGDLAAGVDDHHVVAPGQVGNLLVEIVGWQADRLDGRQGVRALCLPGEGRGLRVGVDDEDVEVVVSEASGEAVMLLSSKARGRRWAWAGRGRGAAGGETWVCC